MHWLLPVFVVLFFVPLLGKVFFPNHLKIFVYIFSGCAELLTFVICLARTAGYRGIPRSRWVYFATQFLFRTLIYAVAAGSRLGLMNSTAEEWINNALRVLVIFACLTSLTLFKGGRGHAAIRYIDVFMVLMLCIVHFLIVFSPGYDGSTNLQLPAYSAVYGVALLVAYAARLGARSQFEILFTRIATIYLAIQASAMFLIQIVGHMWLKNTEGWAFTLLYSAAPLTCSYLMLCAKQGQSDEISATPNPLIRNAQASILAIAIIALALVGNRSRPLLSILFILATICLYAARTHLIYLQMLEEQDELSSRAGTMEKLASHDPLTGIGNRRWFESIAALQLQKAAVASLLLIDLDYFKLINDKLGHNAGDAALRALTSTIQGGLKKVPQASFARLGGDEFVVLLPGKSADQAYEIAERLRVSVERLPMGLPAGPSISVGVAWTKGRVALTHLLELADEALYRSKALGRNRVEIAGEEATVFAASGLHKPERRFRPVTS